MQGTNRVLADREATGIDNVKAVDVLGRIDGRDDRLAVDMVGQRQLDEDAVDRIVGVEAFDERDDFVLSDAIRQSVFEALHSRRDRRLALGADINLARWIVADEHDRKAGLAPCPRGKIRTANSATRSRRIKRRTPFRR